MVAVQGKGVE